MNIDVLLKSTENLLDYKGLLVKVIPPSKPTKLKFALNVKKGCGRIDR